MVENLFDIGKQSFDSMAGKIISDINICVPGHNFIK
jgi:hypothetical protein